MDQFIIGRNVIVVVDDDHAAAAAAVCRGIFRFSS